MPTDNYIKLSDAAVILQGRNVDSKKLNTERRGLPYIVGASRIKDARLRCEKYVEDSEKETISRLGDIIISTVGTLGKVGINDVGDCVLSKHVCAVRFVPQILPEYGLLCVLGSLATIIPPDDPDNPKTGFSRKLDAEKIGELPLLLAAVDEQRLMVERMVMLALCFGKAANAKTPEAETLPDDPLALAEQFKYKSRTLLKWQFKAVDEIARLIKKPWETVPEELQLFLEELK
ncbi:MAG: hypothetical protein NC299_13325 [Lachnospiraceae bacterium]|nr:hypothetical protein [Ruminococcus sp.]MCM1276317.1 hypothetical protein [Lachnospiraceae bacterium]